MDFNPTFSRTRWPPSGFTLAHPELANPPVLDRPRNRLPADRRSDRQGPGKPVRDERLDPGRLAKKRPIDRNGPRQRLADALDAIFAEPIDPRHMRDAVEGKLFGIGSESYVVGSHEFYFGYALSRQKLLCLDAGHYHPTEVVSDKISAVLAVPGRDPAARQPGRPLGQRPRGDPLRRAAGDRDRSWSAATISSRVHIGLDFFDASINRVAAWVIGARAHAQGAVARAARADRDAAPARGRGRRHVAAGIARRAEVAPLGRRLGSLLPHPGSSGRPDWLAEVKTYERDVLSKRG